MYSPRIISMTYSMHLGKEAYEKCVLPDSISLAQKLVITFFQIKEVTYPLNHVHTIRIKFRVNSIKEVDPKYNNELWQSIAGVINNHIM